jgi:hypothetical protein
MKLPIAEGVMYWKIRFNKVNAQYYMECLENGDNRKMSMKDYDSLVDE